MKTPLRNLCRAGVGALLSASALAAALTFAPAAQAQAPSRSTQAQRSNVRFPAGLHWQVMPQVSFGFSPKQYGTPAERELAGYLWQKELASLPVNPVTHNGGKYPAFILLSVIDSDGLRYIFTSFSAASAAYPRCEDAPNGGDASTPIYSMCPMRVVIQDRASGTTREQDFPHYCYQYADDPETPLAQNHTEVAVDSRTRTAYFRVFQYGKLVPQCNRSIKLQG